MTDSTYNIVATFVGTDKVAAGFKKIQDEITKTSKMFIEANKAQVKAVQSLGSEWKKMTSETSKIRTKGFEDATRGTRKLQQEQLKAIQEVSGTLKKSYDEEEKRRKAQEEKEKKNWAEKVNKAAEAAEKIKKVWKETSESIGKYAEAGMKVAESRDRLKTLIPDSGEYDKAAKAIQGVVTSLQGVKEADVTSTFADLYKSLGSTDKAAEALKLASEYQFAMANQFGEKFKPEQLQEQAVGGFEFLEKAGLAENTKKAKEYFDVLTKLATFSKGDITAATLNPLLSSGFSLKGLTPEGLMTMALAMKEMGSSSGALTATLGRIQTGGLKMTKAGRSLLGITPDDLIKAVQTNPREVAEILRTALSKQKIDPANINATADAIKKMFVELDNGGAAAMAQLAKFSEEMGGQEAQVQKMADTNTEYGKTLDSVSGRLKELRAAEENTKAAIGQGVLAAYGSLAQAAAPAIKAISDYLMLHPALADMVGIVGLAGKTLAGVVNTMAVVRQSGLLDFFRGKLFSSVEAETDPHQMWENLFKPGIEESFVGTGSVASTAGLGLGTALIGGFALALAGYGIEQVIEDHLHNKQLQQQADDAGMTVAEILSAGIDTDSLKGLPKAAREKMKKQQQDRTFANLGAARAREYAGEALQTSGAKSITWALGRIANPEPEMIGNEEWSAERVKAQGMQIVVDSLLKNVPIGSPQELQTFSEGMQRQLIAQDHTDWIPAFKQALASAFPKESQELQQMMADAKRSYAAAGIVVDSLGRMSQAVDDTTTKILKAGDKVSGGKTGESPGAAGTPGKPSKITPQDRRDLTRFLHEHSTPGKQPATGKQLATGGIVQRPTYALVGERGPEAVVPLSHFARYAGHSFNFSIAVHAGQTTGSTDLKQTGEELARTIMRKIEKRMRELSLMG